MLTLGLTLCAQARADNLRLFNGREFIGILKEADDESITLDIGIGVVKFHRWEIKDIERWSESENQDLREEWAKKRIYDEVKEEPSLRSTNPLDKKK